MIGSVSLEKWIDEMVYALYGLTEEKIKVAEGILPSFLQLHKTAFLLLLHVSCHCWPKCL